MNPDVSADSLVIIIFFLHIRVMCKYSKETRARTVSKDLDIYTISLDI